MAVELETLWALASATATVDTSSKESGTLWALSSATASVGTSAVESETLWALEEVVEGGSRKDGSVWW